MLVIKPQQILLEHLSNTGYYVWLILHFLNSKAIHFVVIRILTKHISVACTNSIRKMFMCLIMKQSQYYVIIPNGSQLK